MMSELIRNTFIGKFFETITTRNLLILHFAINSLGLIVISTFIASLLAQNFSPSIYESASFYSWAKPVGGVALKLSSILQYVFSVIVLMASYGIYLLLSKSINNFDSILIQHRINKTLLYFTVTVIINMMMFTINLERYSVLIVLWLFLFSWFPFYILNRSAPKVLVPKWATKAFFVVLLVQYAFVFIPLIFNQMEIKNDYINISERTVLKSGKVVDNLDYVNSHRIAGLQINDPRKENNLNQTSVAYSRQKIENCQLVLNTLNAINDKKEHQYLCDENNNFITKTPFTADEKALLSTLNLSRTDRQNIDQLFISSNQLERSIQKRRYSSEELEFIRKNGSELINQAKSGWFLYHHGYNFGVMNALNLGANPNSQTMVYGWLSTAFQAKLLNNFGLSNYQGYFQLFFTSYLIYFSIFLVSIWAIFKRFNTLLFATLLSVITISLLGSELIKLAPGFNPIRHFFDAIIFYLFYQYLVKNSLVHFISALIIALFAILWSKDFGLFISLSLAAAIIFKALKPQHVQWSLFIFGIGFAIAGLGLYIYPHPGANPTAIYMLLGVGSPQAHTKTIIILLITISMMLFATIRIKQPNELTILSVAMAFYFVQSLTYYIWYPNLHHILGVAPVFIFWLTLLFHGWHNNKVQNMNSGQSVIWVLPIFLIYFFASINFYWNQYISCRAFNHHQAYQWNFDQAKFMSTMDPTLFAESVALIKKYSRDQNAIYIISKYDHFLPILANKYSAMPYNELLTNIVSPKEAEVASEHILKNNPDFIYIDADVNKNLNGELPIELDPATIQLRTLSGEATARINVMQGLKKVYALVEKKYEICEPGRLISVYCRKQD